MHLSPAGTLGACPFSGCVLMAEKMVVLITRVYHVEIGIVSIDPRNWQLQTLRLFLRGRPLGSTSLRVHLLGLEVQWGVCPGQSLGSALLVGMASLHPGPSQLPPGRQPGRCGLCVQVLAA